MPSGEQAKILHGELDRLAVPTLAICSIIITAHDHCWTPQDFVDQQKSGITVRVIKPLTDGYYRKGADRFSIYAEVAGWEQRGKAAMALLQDRADSSHGKIRIVRTVDDIQNIKHHHAAGIILSFEGGRPLAAKLENLAAYSLWACGNCSSTGRLPAL